MSCLTQTRIRTSVNRRGFITAPELIFLLTIGVIGMVVGYSILQASLNEEFTDIAGSVGRANQSYSALDVEGDNGLTTDAGAWGDRFDEWDYGTGTNNANSVPVQHPVLFIQHSDLTQEEVPVP